MPAYPAIALLIGSAMAEASEKTWKRAVQTGAFGASFFLSVSDAKTLARGEADIPKADADWFYEL